MKWILLAILLHHETMTSGGNAAGVTQIEFKTEQQCLAALAKVKQMHTFREGICIERASPQEPKS